MIQPVLNWALTTCYSSSHCFSYDYCPCRGLLWHSFRDSHHCAFPSAWGRRSCHYSHHHRMDDRWSDAEVIILIYFISRGFTDLAVSHILHVRGYRRPLSAVWQMLQVILEQFPYLRTTTGRWDIDQVDWWIDSLSLEHEAVNWLISCTEIDAAIAEEVCET